MDASIRLTIAGLLPPALSVLLFLLGKRTRLGKLKYIWKQLITGILFGALAVFGTEWGIPMKGAVMNCRDAAPLCAGLLFGAPAGSIAGVIGGVDRWIAVAWGVGRYTRSACSVSTLVAGLYAAGLRKLMFDNRRPGFIMAAAIGLVIEVFHLTMVFVTNMNDASHAASVVKVCTVPMLLCNTLSTMLSALLLQILSGELRSTIGTESNIAQTIQRWMLLAVVIAFAITTLFMFSVQTGLSNGQTRETFRVTLKDMVNELKNISSWDDDPNERKELFEGLLKVGEHHIGKDGFVIILDENGDTLYATSGTAGENATADELRELSALDKGRLASADINGIACLVSTDAYEGIRLIAALPEEEIYEYRNTALMINTFMEILVFGVLFAMIYQLIKRVVVDRLRQVNGTLGQITDGNLDVSVDVRSNTEFSSLSDDINSTVATLKNYIADAAKRIDAELEYARNIQYNAMPNKFPAYPNRKEFDIYALMNPAKEVGGDFYDFYPTHHYVMNFMIADVSGKGIPAAMYMMRAKTTIKGLTEAELPVDEVFTRANRELCEGNDAGMFLTAWMGKIDLKTGVVSYAVAGHNPPLLRRNGGKFEYLHSANGFVMAGLDEYQYKPQQMTMQPGDVIYLYTDGVTEATDSDNQLFGEQRLLDALNEEYTTDMKALCDRVKTRMDAFVGDAPQFDDITMLAFAYYGVTRLEWHRDCAQISDIPDLTEAVEAELQKMGCSARTVNRVSVIIDEIYSNIVYYAYKDTTGPATVRLDEQDRTIRLVFTDRGVPYNPIKKEDPDVALSAEERDIGGLGIFMVKKMTDGMVYEYRDEQNILQVTVRLD